MELNDLYDHLWNMGTLLQGKDALSVLDDSYRPWPRVRFNEGPSRHYYDRLEKNKAAERAELKQYEQRPDLDVYGPILLEVLQLFGTAIHTSLERTLGKYLKSTDGIFRNELRDDWELDMVAKLLCTNNPAEMPFAVAKGYQHVLPQTNNPTLTRTTPPYSYPFSVYENLSNVKFKNASFIQSKHVQRVSSSR